MNRNHDITVDQQELEASLSRLEIRELEERMEVSPLLAGGDTQTADRCVCEISCSEEELPEYTMPVAEDYRFF